MPQNIAPPGLISLLAAALAQQPTKPLVLALDGRCGSGKTTLTNALLRQYMHNTEIAVTMRLSTILKTIKQPL